MEKQMMEEFNETSAEFKKRKISHYVIIYTISCSSIMHTALLISLWPYLNKLDPTADKYFLGYLAAIGAVGTTCLCPIFGKWANISKNTRLPIIFTLLCGICSYSLYISLPQFSPGSRRYWFLAMRFFIGLSDINIGLSRGYIAESTLNHERRKAVSLLTAFQTVAFACGPAVQSLLVHIGERGVWIIKPYLKFDMYTAIGWLGLLLILINLILFHPTIFQSFDMRHVGNVGGISVSMNKYYKVLAWLYILLHFILVCNYFFLKVLGTPLMMDEYEMTRSDALQYNSYIVFVGAIVSLVAIVLMNFFCKYCGEMNVLYFGFILMIIGRFIMYPMSGEVLKTTINQTSLGCPQWSQTWCAEEKQMYLSQFITSNMFDNIGYALSVTIIYTKFSHIFGTKQQGTWMGIMTSFSGLARILAPLVLSNIYAMYGNGISVLTTNFVYIISIIGNLWLIYYFTKKGTEIEPNAENCEILVNDFEKEMTLIKNNE